MKTITHRMVATMKKCRFTKATPQNPNDSTARLCVFLSLPADLLHFSMRPYDAAIVPFRLSHVINVKWLQRRAVCVCTCAATVRQ